MPRVNLYATLRDLTGEKSLNVSGGTVKEVIEALAARWPVIKAELLEGDEVADGYSVFINGRDVRYLEGLQSPVAEDDVIDIFPPVAGGGRFSTVFGGVSPQQFQGYLKKWGATPAKTAGGRSPALGFATGKNRRPRSVPGWWPSSGVEVEGDEAERWWKKITLACMRGGG